MEAVPAAQARDEVEFFLEQLLQKNPALIGGNRVFLSPGPLWEPELGAKVARDTARAVFRAARAILCSPPEKGFVPVCGADP